jgi:hypothetical protein
MDKKETVIWKYQGNEITDIPDTGRIQGSFTEYETQPMVNTI